MSIATSGRTSMRAQAGLPLLFLFATAGLALVLWGGYQTAHAAGLAGTPGTLKVVSCDTVGEGKGAHIGCAGTFKALDGSVTDPTAVVSVPLRLSAGSVVNTDRVGAGDYVRISLQRTVGWFALLLLGLMMVATAPASLLSRRVESNPRLARPSRWAGLAVLNLLIGAAVFGVMAFVLSFTMS
jgi:hypothetical protein